MQIIFMWNSTKNNMRLKIVLIGITWMLSLEATCQLNNMNVLPYFPSFELEVFDDSFKGYYLFGLAVNDIEKDKFIAVLDHQGNVIWWKNQKTPYVDLDFKFNTELEQYLLTSVSSAESIRHIRLNSNFEVIDTIEIQGPYSGDTHDFLVLPNGNRIITGQNRTLMNLSAYTFKGQQGSDSTTVRSNVIQEFDSNDSLIQSWDGINFIHPTEFIDDFNYNKNDFDYTHINAVDMDVDGNLLVSMRHTNSIFKIDWANKTGNIIWRLGGKSSDFTFIGDTVPFSGQHHIRALPNGQYSLFDNGNSKSTLVSRAIHYYLDTVNMTAEAKWIYKHPTNVYGGAMGNNHFVSDDYSLINWGRVFRPVPTFTLANRQGATLVNFYAENKYLSYRAFAYETLPSFSRPNITCDLVNDEYLLSAPLGYDDYLWTTGETSTSITVSDTNTYMVWVNSGVGYVASMPFSVADDNNPCRLSTAILNEFTVVEKRIKFIYDISGRHVSYPKQNQMYIVKYESGQSELVFWNDGLTQKL